MAKIAGGEAVVEGGVGAVLAPSVMGGDHHICVSLLEVYGTSGDVRDVHLRDLRVLSLADSGAVHTHQEDVFGAVRFVDIVNVHQVGVKTVGGLGRVIHYVACAGESLCVVCVYVESHIGVLRNAVLFCGSEVQIADCGK